VILYKINDYNMQKELKILGCSNDGIKIMHKKAKVLKFYIKSMRVEATNILKQDALSIGAELALPKDAITCKIKEVDGILMCNQKQLRLLIKKELKQPFGLKNIAIELKKHLQTKEFEPQIMGVLNINNDSFYSKSRVNSKEIVSKIQEMIIDGANIIDIGAVSSRPGSEYVGVEEEFKRIKPIVDIIYKNRFFDKVKFSIDSFSAKIIDYALDHGFKTSNDITGLRDDEVCQVVGRYKADVVIMHMQGTPKDMQINPSYNDVIVDIDDLERIKKAISIGMKIEDIILDVGIGFGKTVEHNLTLINNMTNFKKFTCPILIGASRKSLIDNIVPTPIENRLAGTLAIHLKAIDNGANIVRCHDVKEHYQAIKVWEAMSPSYPT